MSHRGIVRFVTLRNVVNSRMSVSKVTEAVQRVKDLNGISEILEEGFTEKEVEDVLQKAQEYLERKASQVETPTKRRYTNNTEDPNDRIQADTPEGKLLRSIFGN